MVRSLLLFHMFFWVTFHVTAGEIVIDFAHPQFARLDAEGKKLLSEYAQSYPKIRDFYKNMRMDVTVKTTDNLSEESLQAVRLIGESQGLNEIEITNLIDRTKRSEALYEIRHRLSDEYYGRIDRKMYHPITPSMRNQLPQELLQRDFILESDVTLLTPTTGYKFSKNDPRQQHFSLNVKRDFSNPNANDITIAVRYFDMAPFASENMSLEDILFQSSPIVPGKPYPIVEYVRQKEINGEQTVEIRLVSSRHIDFNPDDIRGEIRLCRDYWVVKETFVKILWMTSGDIGWTRSSCFYDGMVDGVPLLKAYQRSNGGYDKETQTENVSRRMQCIITNLIPGPPDLSEFDVSQFLPPGVKIGEFIEPTRFTTARIVAIVIGIILVILGIYLRLRRVRE